VLATNYVENEHGIFVPAFYSRNDLGRLDIPQTGAVPAFEQIGWVPTNEAELDGWAAEQFERWAKPEVERMFRNLIGEANGALSLDVDFGSILPENEMLDWGIAYLSANGPPRNGEQAVRMMLAFMDAQSGSIGIHPAYLGAADALINFPQTGDEALSWSLELANSVASYYGFAIPTALNIEGLFMATITAAMMQAGFSYAAIVTVTVESLWDGKVSYDEIRGIVITTGAVIGAVVGQYFGIPAPIGSFIGGLTTAITFDLFAELFGWGPPSYEKRLAAMNAARQLKRAVEADLFSLNVAAWNEYNYVWNDVVANLQNAIEAQVPWLDGGLRYFSDQRVTEVPDGKGGIIELPHIIDNVCRSPFGCPYFTAGSGTVLTPADSGSPPTSRNNQRGIWYRTDNYDPFGVPQVAFTGGLEHGGKFLGRPNAYAALAFYGATRFTTPDHAFNEMYGSPGSGGPFLHVKPIERRMGWEQGDLTRPDVESLQSLAVARIDGTYTVKKVELKDISVEAPFMGFSQKLLSSMTQLGPASMLISQDIMRTATAAMVEYSMAQRIKQQGVQKMEAQAAAARLELINARRAGRAASSSLNGGLLAAGTGALAAFALSELLGR